MDNGINDMAQVLNVSERYFELSIKLTKGGLNMFKNFLMLLKHAFDKHYEKNLVNSNGKVKMKKLRKISTNLQFCRIPNDKESIEHFIKLCKKHGIPVTKLDGMMDSKITHFAFPAEYAGMMESVLAFMQKYETQKNEKEGLSKAEAEVKAKEESRIETAEEAAKDCGCDMPHEEFKQKFLEKHPEEKAYYNSITDKKKDVISIEQKKEIKTALKRNENRSKSRKFEKENRFFVDFSKDQIIGKVERDNNKFIKVRFENDFSKAYLVDVKSITLNGNKMRGAFSTEGNITVFDLKNNVEKTVKFKDFIQRFKNESKSGKEKKYWKRAASIKIKRAT